MARYTLAVDVSKSGAVLGGHQGRPPPLIFTCKHFFRAVHLPFCQYLLQNVCVCVTVKIQFDNTSTCKYSIILPLRSVAMLLSPFGPPYSKILDPPLKINSGI